MFDQLVTVLSGGAAALIKLALGFLILPYFFLYLNLKVQEAFRSAWVSLRSIGIPAETANGRELASRLQSLRNQEGAVFDLDLWLIVAAATYLCGIFSLGDLATYSTLFSEVELGNQAEELANDESVSAQSVSLAEIGQGQVRGALNAYGIAIILICGYYLYARYVSICRKVADFERELYAYAHFENADANYVKGNAVPPSGYDQQQVGSIEAFLRSCSRALLNEAYDRNETVAEALSREITSIKNELEKAEPTEFQRRILFLTSDFYSAVAQVKPKNVAAYRSAVDQVLAQFSSEVAAIHIVEQPA